MVLSTGQIINGRYRIAKLLKQGGYGAIYRAWDINLEEPIALKESFGISPSTQEQFKLEAKLLFKLHQSNLPRVHDYFIIPDQAQYLVMEFIEGQDLQEMIDDRGGPLAEEDVMGWIGQVCDGLSYLHSQVPPIIHRDIKPANIKITPQNKAVLVDFGIAKVYDPKLATAVGARGVTSGYSPPEQYGFGSTDNRSDIYSLGATCYTLLTDKVPPDSVDIMTKRVAPLPPAKNINPRVSSWMSDAIEKAMQLDCSQRYQTIEELKTGLSQTVKVSYQPAAAVIQPVQTPARAPSRSIPWKWIGAIGAIGALSLMVILLLVLMLSGVNVVDRIKPSTPKTTNALGAISKISPTLPEFAPIVPTTLAFSPTGDLTLTRTSEAAVALASQSVLQSLTPGVQNTPTPSSILLEKWAQQGFVEISKGCEIPNERCWKTDCSGNEAALIGETEIFVDPEWKSPYLVFWNKYILLSNANILVKVDRQWEYLKILSNGRQESWKEEFIDLSKYAGKNILFSFSMECEGTSAGSGGNWAMGGGYTYKAEWYLQNIKIVPAFEPPP